MIFDNDKIKELVIKYNNTPDKDTLSDILIGCKRLVEAIVSAYDPYYRDDLIQESYMRIQYALKYYDKSRSLHTFLTTVIKNNCCTYLTKHSKSDNCEEISEELSDDTNIYDNHILSDLISRNHDRFNSLDRTVCDKLSEEIYYSIVSNEKQRQVITRISNTHNMDIKYIESFYNSCKIFIRYKCINYADMEEIDIEEIDIDNDIKELLGDSIYKHIKILFKGIPIRL